MWHAVRMKIRQIAAIEEVPAEQWDGLLNNDYPFMRHAFLAALEIAPRYVRSRAGATATGTLRGKS